MRKFATAIAAVSLMAGAAQVHAQGQGRGNGGGGNDAAAGQQGNGGGNADRGNRGNGNGSTMQASRGSDNRGGNDNASSGNRGNGGGNDRGNGGGNVARDDRGNGGGNVAREDRGNGNGNAGRSVERAENGNGNGNNGNRGNIDRGNGNDRVAAGNRGNDRESDVVRVTSFSDIDRRGLIDGCPPGLAKKNPPCVPPGQVNGGDRYYWDRPDFWGFTGLGDGRYFYDDGYLVRYGSGGGILGYLPLLGGALSIGNAWPSYYQPVALPNYYESYYGLGPYQSYRYADDVIYRVDPETSAITSIAALLTGDTFAVGQRMPLGYDVYNVPYQYRSQYADGPNSQYRYADGYIYQVDPETRLIAAAIELLAS